MSAPLPTIASFWHGPPLSWMEQICMMSWRDAGHRFVLYRLVPLEGVPDGIEQRDARELLAPSGFPMPAEDKTAAAIYSDMLRLEILAQTGATWVDLDAYCLKPLTLDAPYLFAPGVGSNILTGVLRLPPESPALHAMREWLAEPNPIRPWRRPAHRQAMRKARAAGERWTFRDMPWGTTGPKAMGHFLRQSGEDVHALPRELFYPLFKESVLWLFQPNVPLGALEPEGAYSLHLFGYTRTHLEMWDWRTPPGSHLERLARRHGIITKPSGVAALRDD
ncbi:MAG: hypothetical protein AAGJ96_04525 [Pseudomonadota bacterium]